jgi:hypothetical protein
MAATSEGNPSMTTIISSVEDLCNVFTDVYSDDVYESKECAIEAAWQNLRVLGVLDSPMGKTNGAAYKKAWMSQESIRQLVLGSKVKKGNQTKQNGSTEAAGFALTTLRLIMLCRLLARSPATLYPPLSVMHRCGLGHLPQYPRWN